MVYRERQSWKIGIKFAEIVKQNHAVKQNYADKMLFSIDKMSVEFCGIFKKHCPCETFNYVKTGSLHALSLEAGVAILSVHEWEHSQELKGI